MRVKYTQSREGIYFFEACTAPMPMWNFLGRLVLNFFIL